MTDYDNDNCNTEAQLATVAFHGQILEIIDRDGRAFVPVKRICANLGLDWSSQFKRMQRDEILAEGMVSLAIPSAGGVQESVCLPLEYLNGWLFGVSENQVDPRIREGVLRYKREAYTALHDYFYRGFALDRARLDNDVEARETALRELRKLRTEDKQLWRKVTDAIARTSTDYEEAKKSAPKRVAGLFARIQDMFHHAVSGKTAQQLVIENCDGSKPMAGMIAYDGPVSKITKADLRTGKNFLDRIPFRQLQILYEQLFLFAENKIIGGEEMTLAKWERQLDKLLEANGFEPWNMYAEYLATEADQVAAREYERFKQRQKTLPAA